MTVNPANSLRSRGQAFTALKVYRLGAIALLLAASAVGAVPAFAEPPAPNPAQAEAAKSDAADHLGGQTAPAEGTPAVVLDDYNVESLLGKEVKSASGQQLGRIVDVLVSRAGELRAAVIDFGGFLGVGTRKVAVAWTALTFTSEGPVLSMTIDELRLTPEYRVGEPIVVVGAPAAEHAAPAQAPPPNEPLAK